jgi:hypothetical protein
VLLVLLIASIVLIVLMVLPAGTPAAPLRAAAFAAPRGLPTADRRRRRGAVQLPKR